MKACLRLLVLMLVVSGCAGAPVAGGGRLPVDPVAAVRFGLAAGEGAAYAAKADAIARGDGLGCVAASTTAGGIRMAQGVMEAAAAELAAPDGHVTPPDLVVDAASCVALGLPLADDRAATRVLEVVSLICDATRTGFALASAACHGTSTADTCYPMDVAQSALGMVGQSVPAILGALAAEEGAPDGRVTISVGPLSYPLRDPP